jgi:cytosine/adenosine deaminase-related metal-dependent hydrolase
MDFAIINTWLITFEGKGLGIIRYGGIGIEDGKVSFVGKMDNFDYKNDDIILGGMGNHVGHGILSTSRFYLK